MTRRMMLLALVSVMMLIIAACEDLDEADDAAEEVLDDDGSADDGDTIEVGDSDEVEEPTPEPEPTEEPTPELTEAPEAEEGSSRDNPVPFGQSVVVEDWEIQVIDTIPDATQIVLEENQFNDPPQEGHQFFIARIQATYVGEESGTFWLDTSLKAVDDGGVVYEGTDARCGVIPDDIADRGESFPGATIEGNTCWSTNSEMADSLIMIGEAMFSWDGDRVFFALSGE